MEREFWSELSQAICEVGGRWKESHRFTHPTALIVRVHLWSALHDRPTSWACHGQSWDSRTRPLTLPDQSTMSRRLRSKEFKSFMTALSARMAGQGCSSLLKRMDGKSLLVAAHSIDRQASWGRAAGCKGRGYKLHVIWSDRPMPEQWIVTPLNVCEKKMARRMLRRLGQAVDCGAGYVLADANYDSSVVHDQCAASAHQLLAPRPRPGTGLGHHYNSAHRIRSIEMLEPPAGINEFGLQLYGNRKQVERDLGNLSGFGGGLSGLPAWVRGVRRVRMWTWAKLLVNAARIRWRRRNGT
jgi:hypothetical protein